jgi:hypothetical protein
MLIVHWYVWCGVERARRFQIPVRRRAERERVEVFYYKKGHYNGGGAG